MPRRKSDNAIIDAQNELERLTNQYLHSHGWKYTSNTPGCLWLWQKATEDGRILLVDTSTALSMQQHSCAIRGNKW